MAEFPTKEGPVLVRHVLHVTCFCLKHPISVSSLAGGKRQKAVNIGELLILSLERQAHIIL